LLSELLHRADVPDALPARYQVHLQDLVVNLGARPLWKPTALLAHPVMDLLRKWFHALEEADYRGINLREMKQFLE